MSNNFFNHIFFHTFFDQQLFLAIFFLDKKLFVDQRIFVPKIYCQAQPNPQISKGELSWFYFSNGPDDVSCWHSATFVHVLMFYSVDLYWTGCDKSCSTVIGRHKLGLVQTHVYHPLTKLWCVHLLIPAMQGVTERCRTQIF